VRQLQQGHQEVPGFGLLTHDPEKARPALG
jgi:hypothetical protein